MKKGFTLIELIVVVIIIGILATVAVPQYLKATERAKSGKARNAINLIAKAEKMYRADSNTDVYVNFASGAAQSTLGNYTELGEVDVDNDWNYTVTGASATAFTITGTRKNGANAAETLTLDANGTWAGTFTP